jgi:Scavenger mRNA decapping enzyme C-term binding
MSPQAGVLFRSRIPRRAGQVFLQDHAKARKQGLLIEDHAGSRYRTAFEVGKNGHLYPATRSVGKFAQAEKTPITLQISDAGFDALREKYATVNGAPEFIHELYALKESNQDAQALMEHPRVFSYFSDPDIPGFNFIVMPNFGYKMSPAVLECKPCAKFEMPGIMLCSWFHSPHQNSVGEKIQKILEELKPGVTFKPNLKKAIGSFRAKTIECLPPRAGAYKAQEKSIKKLRDTGIYLSSVLDLEPAHAPALMRLKAHTELYLKNNYNISDQDQVDMYFHCIYGPFTTTLHLHTRVNQGITAFERDRSISLDEAIKCLSSGKTIKQLLLNKIKENPESAFHDAAIPGFIGFFMDENGSDLIPGVSCQTNVKNSYKVGRRDSEALQQAENKPSTSFG